MAEASAALQAVLDALPALTDDEAMTVAVALDSTHGFASIAYCRGDVDSFLRDCGLPVLTDAEWRVVRSSWSWRKFSQWAPDSAGLFPQLLDDEEVSAVLAAKEAAAGR